MFEERMRAFADDAARRVDLPDLDGLARRGRNVRARRGATAAVAALAVAVLAGWALQDRSPRADDQQPVQPPVQAYPGNQMHDIPAGTYELLPSSVPSEPTAMITLPAGWNSWEGPNRFDGHRPGDPTEGRYNETALSRSTWYVGVLVVKLLGVTRERCLDPTPSYRRLDGYDATVDGLTRVPGFRVHAGPEETTAFGHRATHLVLVSVPGLAPCRSHAEADTFISSANGLFGGLEHQHVWVVDVDGVALTVFAGRSGSPPLAVRAQQEDVVASIEFRPGA